MTTTNVCSSFPFSFKDKDGNEVAGEIVDGLCTFPDANCRLESAIQDCCQAKQDKTEYTSEYMFIAFAFIFIPYAYLKYSSNTTTTRSGGNNNGDEDEKEEAKAKDDIPFWVDKIPLPFIKRIFKLGLWVYITLQVVVPIYMRKSLQEELNVGSRNALIAAEAFMVPYSEIFQFIEDIVLVRVNYALGRGDKKLTDQLVHAGIVGSIGSGVLAAIVATVLGLIPKALAGLTNPGYENDLALYPECDLFESENSGILHYWMLAAWQIPGSQLGLVLSGFMMGAMELATIGWIGAIALSLTPIIWFALVSSSTNRLLLLASAEFAAAWGVPVLCILYMISPLGKDLRENTGVVLRLEKMHKSFVLSFKGGSGDAVGLDDKEQQDEGKASPANIAVASPSFKSEGTDEDRPELLAISDHPPPKITSTKDLLRDGLKIMVMDVVIQSCVSLSIYLALARDAAIAYQLTALQSALPTYGVSYALGMGIMFKVAGPQLIATGQFERFASLARITLVCAFLLIPLVLGAVIPFREELAFDYGGNACAYASNATCLPFFTEVFGENGGGGDFTLSFTFNAFALGASVESIFYVLRAMLLACMDLDYMVKSTVVAIIVYIPAIAVAASPSVGDFGGEAIAFFVAIYIPQVVLILSFVVRLNILIHRMLRGEKGPWSNEVYSLRSSMLLQS